MITIDDALASLRPGAAYVMYADDVTTIEWHTDGVAPVTQADVNAEIARLEADATAKAEADAAATAAAVAHAKSLGFTDAMISAMYPGLVIP